MATEMQVESVSDSHYVTLAREAAIQSFWSFCNLADMGGRLNEMEHKPLCDDLQAFASSDERIMVIIKSRDLLKTTIACNLFSMWLLITQNPNMRILLEGGVHAQAMERLASIQNLLETKTAINACFPDIKKAGYVWNREALDVGLRTDFSAKESSLQTSGIDVERTGAHVDMIIMDDLVSGQNVRTKEQIDGVISHIKAIIPFASRTEDNKRGGKILFINTPWAEKDAVYWMMNLDVKKRVHVGRAYEPAELDIVDLTYEQFMEKGGKLNYPMSLPFDTLKMNRVIMGASLFFSQYQICILAGEDAKFDVSKVKYIKRESLPQGLRFYIAVDPAGDPTIAAGSKKDGDNVSIAVVGFGQRSMYLADVVSGRFTENETIEKAVQLINTYKPFVSGVETTGLGNLITHLKSRLDTNPFYSPTDIIRPGGRSKFSRISELAPYLDSGEFYIVEDARGKDDVLYQMSRITNGGFLPNKVDEIDSVAMTLDLASKYGKPIGQEWVDDSAPVEAYAGPSRNVLDVMAYLKRQESHSDFADL
jgi:hypothetical protein